MMLSLPSHNIISDRNTSPRDRGRTSKCNREGKINNDVSSNSSSNSSMVRRNFSMLRPFSRRKNNSCEKAESCPAGSNFIDVDPHARKVSIDQTVLSGMIEGDDGRLYASQDFSTSFDAGDGPVNVVPPNNFNFPSSGSYGYATEEFGSLCGALYMKPSLSEPSFLHHHPDNNGPVVSQSQPVYGSHSPGGRVPTPPTTTLSPQPQHPSSPKPNDPALQARTEAIRIQQKLLGDNHPDVMFALSSLARLHKKRGNHAEAASIVKELQTLSMMAKKSALHNAMMSRQNPQDDPSVPTEIRF